MSLWETIKALFRPEMLGALIVLLGTIPMIICTILSMFFFVPIGILIFLIYLDAKKGKGKCIFAVIATAFIFFSGTTSDGAGILEYEGRMQLIVSCAYALGATIAYLLYLYSLLKSYAAESRRRFEMAQNSQGVIKDSLITNETSDSFDSKLNNNNIEEENK